LGLPDCVSQVLDEQFPDEITWFNGYEGLHHDGVIGFGIFAAQHRRWSKKRLELGESLGGCDRLEGFCHFVLPYKVSATAILKRPAVMRARRPAPSARASASNTKRALGCGLGRQLNESARPWQSAVFIGARCVRKGA